jgi:hypothetical protein
MPIVALVNIIFTTVSRWRPVISLALIAVFAGCRLPSRVDDLGMVTNLKFSPSAFDSFKRNTDIRYTLKSPATLNIYIVRKDSAGTAFLVRNLALAVHETKGSHSHTWLGDNENGLFAPIGTYVGVVEFESQQFEATVLVFHY